MIVSLVHLMSQNGTLIPMEISAIENQVEVGEKRLNDLPSQLVVV